MGPILNLSPAMPIPLSDITYIVGLGVVMGVLGIAFNKLLLATQDLYQRQRWLTASVRPVVPFLLAGVFGLTLPQVLGGGNELVNELFTGGYSLKLLFVLLSAKLLFTHAGLKRKELKTGVSPLCVLNPPISLRMF